MRVVVFDDDDVPRTRLVAGLEKIVGKKGSVKGYKENWFSHALEEVKLITSAQPQTWIVDLLDLQSVSTDQTARLEYIRSILNSNQPLLTLKEKSKMLEDQNTTAGLAVLLLAWSKGVRCRVVSNFDGSDAGPLLAMLVTGDDTASRPQWCFEKTGLTVDVPDRKSKREWRRVEDFVLSRTFWRRAVSHLVFAWQFWVTLAVAMIFGIFSAIPFLKEWREPPQIVDWVFLGQPAADTSTPYKIGMHDPASDAHLREVSDQIHYDLFFSKTTYGTILELSPGGEVEVRERPSVPSKDIRGPGNDTRGRQIFGKPGFYAFVFLASAHAPSAAVLESFRRELALKWHPPTTGDGLWAYDPNPVRLTSKPPDTIVDLADWLKDARNRVPLDAVHLVIMSVRAAADGR